VPRNVGGRDLPITIKQVHLAHAANMATSSERTSSILHLARQTLHPSLDRETPSPQYFQGEHPTHQSEMSTPVDDLAAELFAMTLTDNEASSDGHHKLWVSRSEVQRGKANAHLDTELTGNDT
jgi:hypothetical protein